MSFFALIVRPVSLTGVGTEITLSGHSVKREALIEDLRLLGPGAPLRSGRDDNRILRTAMSLPDPDGKSAFGVEGA